MKSSLCLRGVPGRSEWWISPGAGLRRQITLRRLQRQVARAARTPTRFLRALFARQTHSLVDAGPNLLRW
jgi:hypothetical protein